MMKLSLLLGVGSGQPAPLGLHFWLRALEAGFAFVVGLALLTWFMGRLGGRTRRTGGGGGFRRRRAVRPGAVLSTPAPGPARANDVGKEKKPPFVSMSGPVETYIVWKADRPGRSVTPGWYRGATPSVTLSSPPGRPFIRDVGRAAKSDLDGFLMRSPSILSPS